MKEKYRSGIVEGTTLIVQMGASYLTGMFFRIPYCLCINGFERLLVTVGAGASGSVVAKKVGAAVHDWLDENVDILIDFEKEEDPEPEEEYDELKVTC